jgi:energy-coupling factor transport system ATP-binding protein
VIEIDGLGFKYVGRKRPTLRDVSLTVRDGESVLVLGPSGCGKSTLALCLNGAIPHAIAGDLSGSVRVDGLDTRRTSMGQLARRVGIVFQDPEAQFCMLTVEDEVAFGLENMSVPRHEMSDRIESALAAVGLAHRRAERIQRLSGGQKQRLALACVLALEPAVLVLDEPTAQLDPAGAADVMALLGELRAHGRHTLIVVEHRLDDAIGLVDRVVVFNDRGEMVADGAPRRIIQEHGHWLREAGVWTPQVSELALTLEEQGIPVRPFPLTVDEAVEALRQLAARLNQSMSPPSRLAPHPPAPSPACWRGGAGRLGTPLRCDGEGPGEGSLVQPGPLVEVRALNFQYPRAAAPTVRDLNLTLWPGELVAVVGANGAGKSTLARLLAGIPRPPSGAVFVNGEDAAAIPSARLAQDVGYVFQYPEHQFVGQTVLDDVAYGPRRAGLPESEALARARALLDDFGLRHLEAAHPFTLSHGEQRRLSVASMLVLGQSLLLLDEPTFGQDQRNATMLLDKLEALADAGRTIVAISHDMRLVAERAHRVLVMANGALTFDGTPTDLFANRSLLDRASLRQPPLWELSERLGLATPLLDLRSVVVPTSSTANGRVQAGEAVRPGGPG